VKTDSEIEGAAFVGHSWVSGGIHEWLIFSTEGVLYTISIEQ
jgi:hypothetical protein